ncbi:MAG: extracellular matrix regulator RemB [Bacillota bacterium]
MFLHLGKGHMISQKRIVLIGSMESSCDSEITQDFIKTSREEGFIIDYSYGNPKSFILTEEKIYFSIISAKTLYKRMNRNIKQK